MGATDEHPWMILVAYISFSIGGVLVVGGCVYLILWAFCNKCLPCGRKSKQKGREGGVGHAKYMDRAISGTSTAPAQNEDTESLNYEGHTFLPKVATEEDGDKHKNEAEVHVVNEQAANGRAIREEYDNSNVNSVSDKSKLLRKEKRGSKISSDNSHSSSQRFSGTDAVVATGAAATAAVVAAGATTIIVSEANDDHEDVVYSENAHSHYDDELIREEPHVNTFSENEMPREVFDNEAFQAHEVVDHEPSLIEENRISEVFNDGQYESDYNHELVQSSTVAAVAQAPRMIDEGSEHEGQDYNDERRSYTQGFEQTGRESSLIDRESEVGETAISENMVHVEERPEFRADDTEVQRSSFAERTSFKDDVDSLHSEAVRSRLSKAESFKEGSSLQEFNGEQQMERRSMSLVSGDDGQHDIHHVVASNSSSLLQSRHLSSARESLNMDQDQEYSKAHSDMDNASFRDEVARPSSYLVKDSDQRSLAQESFVVEEMAYNRDSIIDNQREESHYSAHPEEEVDDGRNIMRPNSETGSYRGSHLESNRNSIISHGGSERRSMARESFVLEDRDNREDPIIEIHQGDHQENIEEDNFNVVAMPEDDQRLLQELNEIDQSDTIISRDRYTADDEAFVNRPISDDTTVLQSYVTEEHSENIPVLEEMDNTVLQSYVTEEQSENIPVLEEMDNTVLQSYVTEEHSENIPVLEEMDNTVLQSYVTEEQSENNPVLEEVKEEIFSDPDEEVNDHDTGLIQAAAIGVPLVAMSGNKIRKKKKARTSLFGRKSADKDETDAAEQIVISEDAETLESAAPAIILSESKKKKKDKKEKKKSYKSDDEMELTEEFDQETFSKKDKKSKKKQEIVEHEGILLVEKEYKEKDSKKKKKEKKETVVVNKDEKLVVEKEYKKKEKKSKKKEEVIDDTDNVIVEQEALVAAAAPVVKESKKKKKEKKETLVFNKDEKKVIEKEYKKKEKKKKEKESLVIMDPTDTEVVRDNTDNEIVEHEALVAAAAPVVKESKKKKKEKKETLVVNKDEKKVIEKEYKMKEKKKKGKDSVAIIEPTDTEFVKEEAHVVEASDVSVIHSERKEEQMYIEEPQYIEEKKSKKVKKQKKGSKKEITYDDDVVRSDDEPMFVEEAERKTKEKKRSWFGFRKSKGHSKGNEDEETKTRDVLLPAGAATAGAAVIATAGAMSYSSLGYDDAKIEELEDEDYEHPGEWNKESETRVNEEFVQEAHSAAPVAVVSETSEYKNQLLKPEGSGDVDSLIMAESPGPRARSSPILYEDERESLDGATGDSQVRKIEDGLPREDEGYQTHDSSAQGGEVSQYDKDSSTEHRALIENESYESGHQDEISQGATHSEHIGFNQSHEESRQSVHDNITGNDIEEASTHNHSFQEMDQDVQHAIIDNNELYQQEVDRYSPLNEEQVEEKNEYNNEVRNSDRYSEHIEEQNDYGHGGERSHEETEGQNVYDHDVQHSNQYEQTREYAESEGNREDSVYHSEETNHVITHTEVDHLESAPPPEEARMSYSNNLPAEEQPQSETGDIVGALAAHTVVTNGNSADESDEDMSISKAILADIREKRGLKPSQLREEPKEQLSSEDGTLFDELHNVLRSKKTEERESAEIKYNIDEDKYGEKLKQANEHLDDEYDISAFNVKARLSIFEQITKKTGEKVIPTYGGSIINHSFLKMASSPPKSDLNTSFTNSTEEFGTGRIGSIRDRANDYSEHAASEVISSHTEDKDIVQASNLKAVRAGFEDIGAQREAPIGKHGFSEDIESTAGSTVVYNAGRYDDLSDRGSVVKQSESHMDMDDSYDEPIDAISNRPTMMNGNIHVNGGSLVRDSVSKRESLVSLSSGKEIRKSSRPGSLIQEGSSYSATNGISDNIIHQNGGYIESGEDHVLDRQSQRSSYLSRKDSLGEHEKIKLRPELRVANEGNMVF